MAKEAAFRAIAQTLHAYCRYVDEGRVAEFVALYAEDGAHDDGRARRVGRIEIQELIKGVLARYDATSHHLSNVEIVLHGETAARAHSYIYAWHRKAGAADLEVWGRYEDALVLSDGRWLIAERRLFVAGVRGLEGDPGFRPPPRPRP